MRRLDTWLAILILLFAFVPTTTTARSSSTPPASSPSDLISEYAAKLREAINQLWAKPADGKSVDCMVRFTQLPGGELIRADFLQCSLDEGGKAYLRSKLIGTLMPYAGYESVFQRQFTTRLCFPACASVVSDDRTRSETAKLVKRMMTDPRIAYRTRATDALFSEEVFESYLHELDPNARLLSVTTVRSFARYRSTLSDALSTGVLDAAYEMAASRDSAADSRCQMAKAWMPASIATSPHPIGPRPKDDAALEQGWRSEISAAAERSKRHGLAGSALNNELATEFCQGLVPPEQRRNESFVTFVNVFARAIDPRALYASPFTPSRRAAGTTTSATESPSPSSTIINVGNSRVGILTLRDFFWAQGSRNVDVTLTSLEAYKAAGVEAVVLDLRGCRGGPLRAVVDMAGRFLGRRPVMQIREADGRVSVESAKDAAAWTGPLAVLVDNESKAGAEMLAATLQDHGRAMIFGTQTSGEGLIQNPFNLDETGPALRGVLTFTIAEMYRLTGKPLEGVGVTPDLELSLAKAPKVDRASAPPSPSVEPAADYRAPAHWPELAQFKLKLTTIKPDAGVDPVLYRSASILLDLSRLSGR